MVLIVVNDLVNNNQQVDKVLKNLFYLFDLMFVEDLIEYLNDIY
jgi:hypothetical protein